MGPPATVPTVDERFRLGEDVWLLVVNEWHPARVVAVDTPPAEKRKPVGHRLEKVYVVVTKGPHEGLRFDDWNGLSDSLRHHRPT